MAKVKNGNAAESANVSETLVNEVETVETTPQPETVEETPQPEPTNEELLEDLNNQWFDAKEVLNAIEAENVKKRLRTSDEYAKQFIIVSDLDKKILALQKQIDANKMQEKLAADTANAKETLKGIGITEETLNKLLTFTGKEIPKDADEVLKATIAAENSVALGLHNKTLENVKWSFNFLFGKPVYNAKDGEKSKDITKTGNSQQNANGTAGNANKFNMSKAVKDLLDAGGNDDSVFAELSQNPNVTLTEKDLRKRITDIRWGWEKAKGLR